MTRTTLASTAILAAMLVPLLHAAPARATAFVASFGSDNNTCNRPDPCATFQRAHDSGASGVPGAINCVDAGSYDAVTITKSIVIDCDNTQAEILANVVKVFAVTVNAGQNDVVTLKGLSLEGHNSGIAGIVFMSGAALHVHKVRIRNFRNIGGNAPNAGGIYFQPSAYAELYVADSFITDNGVPGSLSGGIIITPGGAGSVNASINRVRLENNTTGIIVDGTRSTGVAVNATILDTVVAGSQSHGILAQSSAGHAAASALIDHSVASGNFGSGVRAVGAAASGQGSAFARLGDSTIVLNATGVSTAGGVLQSFKNNRISGNLTDGTPIPAYIGPGGAALQ